MIAADSLKRLGQMSVSGLTPAAHRALPVVKALSHMRVLGLTPAVSWTLAFFVGPLIVMLIYSFYSFTNFRIVSDATLSNYTDFFTNSLFHTAVKNSFIITASTTVISILIAFPLAYIIAFKIPKRYQLVILVALIIPFWTSYVVRSYAWLTVLSENGLMNKFLFWLGVIDNPIEIVYTTTATVLGFVHFFVMLLTLTIYSSLIQVSRSHLRAAEDLGANAIKVLAYVTIPLALPGIMVGAFLTIVLTFGDYVTPAILGGNTKIVMPQALVIHTQFRGDVPQAAAIGVIMMIILVVVFIAFSRYLRLSKL